MSLIEQRPGWPRRMVVLAVVGMALVCLLSVARPAWGATAPSPLGSLVPSGGGEALGPSVISDGDVLAGAPDATVGVQDEGVVLVYAEPAGGSSVGGEAPIGTLTASDASPGGRLGTSLALVGGDIVVGSSAGRLYVFAPGPNGWAEAEQVAELSASDGAALGQPVVSGTTIFAEGTNAQSGVSEVYAFTEPDEGWSGPQHESAVLSAPGDAPGDQFGLSIAAADNYVAVGAPSVTVDGKPNGAVYAFTEPAGGWSGDLRDPAELTGSDLTSLPNDPPIGAGFGSSVAASGDTIVTVEPDGAPPNDGAAYAFTEPSGGWANATQTAELTPSDGVVTAGSPIAAIGYGLVPQVAISGSTVVVPGSLGTDFTHPAEFVFSEPAGGWSGSEHQSATLRASDNGSLDTPYVFGQTIIAGAVSAASSQAVVGLAPVGPPIGPPNTSTYLFDEPTGGWSGTVEQTAELSDPGGSPDGEEALYAEPATGWVSAGPTSTLTIPNAPGGFPVVAASGGVAVGDDFGDEADVFDEPSGGWSTAEPSATLADPATGDALGALAVTGSTVAALALAPPPPGSAADPGGGVAVDVFTEPVGGWSGSVSPSARLDPGTGASIYDVAADGTTIVTAGEQGDKSLVFVFTEPAGGWSGTVTPSARLVIPGVYDGQIAVDDSVIVAGGAVSGTTIAAPETAYVFREPTDGWQDGQRPTATLTPIEGESGVDVFEEPTDGWVGVTRPSARLLLGQNVIVEGVAVTGQTIAIAAQQGFYKYGSCPCQGGFLLYGEPSAGWSGVLQAPPFVPARTDANGNLALALDGSVLFAGGQPLGSTQFTSLDVFPLPSQIDESAVQPGAPQASDVVLGGLDADRPHVAFTLTAGENAALIASVAIVPPRGFSLSANHLSGSLTGGGISLSDVHLTHGAVHAAVVAERVRLTLGWPGLAESRSLLQEIRRLSKRPGARLVLTTTVTVTDGAGHMTRLRLRATWRAPRR